MTSIQKVEKGRDFTSLSPSSIKKGETPRGFRHMKLEDIPIERLNLPEFDTRFLRDRIFLTRLKTEIALEGLRYPLLVDKTSMVIVDGVNRFTVLTELGYKTVPCILGDFDNEQALITSVKVNLFRKSHDPVGFSESLERLRTVYKISQSDLARTYQITKGYVSKLIRIAQALPYSDKKRLSKGEITIEQAYEIAKVHRDSDLLRSLDERDDVDVRSKCDLCGCKREFGEIELLNVCFECRKIVNDFLLQEDKEQTKLP